MKTNIEILIVEDEPYFAEFLTKCIKYEGFENITHVDTSREAIEIIKTRDIDLIFMDINIKGATDGIQCAKEVNIVKPTLLVYISALDESEILSEAIDSNTLSYILKPFGKTEVKIALELFKHRIDIFEKKNKKERLEFDKGCFYSFKDDFFYYDYKKVMLTNNETKVLNIFIKNPNQSITTQYLQKEIWGSDDVNLSTLRELIARVRKKTKKLPIKTIYGIGYIFETSELSI